MSSGVVPAAWLEDEQRDHRATKAALRTTRAALLSMRELAAVADNGDPWYAEHEGLDAAAIFAEARAALGEE